MRDVTRIPDELLGVIARAIRLHVRSYCASFAARIDALERAEAREPVVNVTSFPIKDHTETIEGLRRAQETCERLAVEDRRAIDRLLGGIDGISERLKTLESHKVALSDTTLIISEHSETIDTLRSAQEKQEQRAAEDCRALDRLLISVGGISERVKTLESRDPVVIPTNIPVRDHTEAIESLRRAQEKQEERAAEDYRALDHLVSCFDGISERIKTIESRELAATKANIPDAIDRLRRTQESDHQQAVKDRRALDRLIGTFDSINERLKMQETREPVAPATNVRDRTDAIESLRRAHEQNAAGAAEDRRALDRLQNSFAALGDRVKTLETREIRVPRDGEPGRDAFEIDVLPVIDFTRDYPRGSLAQHQGGIWRAHANTHGEHGWSCVVDGIGSTRVTMDSERSFTVHIERASGAHETATFALPVMIYRGVYQAGETYRTGDVVTWAGSLWHCNATTDTKPDAGGDAWTLAAKRGRDGKDARMSLVGGSTA
ncbi:hypothetical protein [Caballeronia cordobensis]|uniref:hypothetical protein n=1 Tax=Caballeronia cordobensis TaxID=1353886 RepID=UPI00045EF7CA|nr:putative membrane protein [Burkholderia sp. RPE67]